ncbi:MAG TPA: hypothetical protein ENJ18_10670 [Nannocystis exedens]|nr:hypothetical protein [Nannocystis exedens]
MASELEFPDNSLTTTFLTKIVYLADLAHAEREGDTFTSARWMFLHFGPWSAQVVNRIEPATVAAGGQIRRFEGGVAYSLRRGQQEPPPLLPPHVSTTVRKAIRTYRGETQRLLHHVYRTGPMLRAAPEEELVFARVDLPQVDDEAVTPLTEKKKKLLRRKARAFQESKGQSPKGEPSPIVTIESRPDDAYREGVEWLDTQSSPFPTFDGLAVVDDSLWKSDARGFSEEH